MENLTIRTDNLVVKMTQSTEADSLKWFFRGIRPDGTFYGEVTSLQSRNQKDFTGALTPEQLERVDAIYLQISGVALISPEILDRETWTGILALGSVSAPRIIYKFSPSSIPADSGQARFLELLAILSQLIDLN